MTQTPTPEERANLVSNILAIVGFVIVIVITIWGLLHLAGLSKPFLSSLFKTTNARAQGSASISVSNKTPTPSPETVETSPAKTEKAETVKVGEPGLPDFSVHILSVGVIEPLSGDIIPRRPASANDLVAVRFDIANNGSASTGTWYFTAQIPTNPVYSYSSDAQASLAPGAHIENMLRFRQAEQGGTFSVSVDPANLVAESNESNNTASQNI